MSIRLRLALWYGALTGFVLALMGVFSYAFHSRAHYDDLDQILLTSAKHATFEVEVAEGLPHFAAQLSNLNMVLRRYDENATAVEMAPQVSDLPPISPDEILQGPSTHAFDWVAALAPKMVDTNSSEVSGTFAVVQMGGQRWRVFIRPLVVNDEIAGYIEASAPLGRLDASMSAFRRVLVVLGAGALLAGVAGSWATASGALRPVSRMVSAAQEIAGSKNLSRRVEAPEQRDELSELAHAFNDMLTSLEASSAAQQRFVSDASHELRAPLTAIQGNLELLERHPNMPPEDRQEALKEASRETHRLTRLVADLLALARADAGVSLPQQRVELDEIILDSVRDARHLTKGHNIEIGDLEPVVVSGNPDRLKQLLLILLDNAIKYSYPNGKISVRLHQAGGFATIIVQDNGVGIAPEALAHVFERFYRADPARRRDPGGTGLGLPIAKWIVEQHNGHIRIESEPDRGTTVIVRLLQAG